MKKLISTAIFIFISVMSYCQTPLSSFECHIKTGQSLSQTEISNFISKGNYENYRLQNRRTTLSFDNGFEIVLLSATEAQAVGLVSNAASYQTDFIAKFKMPVFHMTPDGRVSAAYSASGSKYSTEKHK